MARLDGKTVVLIGAGSTSPGWSNGRACAVSYARAGASVVCADRNLSTAEETAAFITEEGGRALAVRADALDEEDVRAAIATAVAELGRIDVLHNNVGFGGVMGTPDEVPRDLWEREISHNLTTAYLGIRCAVPFMREQGGGVIINVSSTMAVRFLRRPNVAYTAAKSAVEAMTKACAVAYGRDDIRVNCIRIGFSETPMILTALDERNLTEEQREAELDKSRQKVPLRQEHGNPFDIGAAATFLASDDAKYVTGVVFSVDGGLELAPL